MENRVVLNANHIRAQYRYIFYSESENKKRWHDTFSTSVFVNTDTIIDANAKIYGHLVSEIQKARKHPLAYHFRKNEYEGVNIWDDPEYYERRIESGLFPTRTRPKWKGGAQ